MASDDGWQTVGAPKQEKKKPRRNQRSSAGNQNNWSAVTRNKSNKSHKSSARQTSGSGWAGVASQGKQKMQQKQKKLESSRVLSAHESDSNPAHAAKKDSKPRKSLEEYGWKDVKQMRRIVAHLEAIANFSKGGVIGSLRTKTIHNSEDRDQDLSPVSTIKINAQEDAFMHYIADFVDVQYKRDPEMDALLGFMTILRSCIEHMRYYNVEDKIDNYWNFHDKFTYKVWDTSSIPTSLHETILRELQEKLQHKPLAIDKADLQRLLSGREFDFRYEGNLTVPYCLNAIKNFSSCNQAKSVVQRRRIYRYENRPGARSNNERKEWQHVAQMTKDYQKQVETFEKLFMGCEGAPVLGISSIDAVLHSIYATFLKIRRGETPQDLLNRLKELLMALPNLIDLPELLLKLNSEDGWCGYKDIESYPDLSDYKDIKRSLEELLKQEGVEKHNSNSEPLRNTLQAIYDFNHTEEQKTAKYLETIASNNDNDETHKGYPLHPKYLESLILQLQLSDSEIEKLDDVLKRVSSLEGLKNVRHTLKRDMSGEESSDQEEEEEQQQEDKESMTPHTKFDVLM